MSCFVFNDTATTEIYTLSLHDALPIYVLSRDANEMTILREEVVQLRTDTQELMKTLTEAADDDARQKDRKSTRLNSSHANISYAVFCLKKKTVSPLYYSPYAP